MKSGATFSADRKYRYTLFREWHSKRPRLLFALLNPSTADENRNDPTITRCIARAINSGYGSVEIVNIFAWRSTKPRNLYPLINPGSDAANDRAIVQACGRAELVICGWGTHGLLHDRGAAVLELIRSAHRIPHALKMNEDGTPQHPLYLAYTLQPFPII